MKVRTVKKQITALYYDLRLLQVDSCEVKVSLSSPTIFRFLWIIKYLNLHVQISFSEIRGLLNKNMINHGMLTQLVTVTAFLRLLRFRIVPSPSWATFNIEQSNVKWISFRLPNSTLKFVIDVSSEAWYLGKLYHLSSTLQLPRFYPHWFWQVCWKWVVDVSFTTSCSIE